MFRFALAIKGRQMFRFGRGSRVFCICHEVVNFRYKPSPFLV